MARPKIPITERDKVQIEAMAGLGLRVEQIATILGISKRTFSRWCKRDDVMAHYKRGQTKAQFTVAQSLYNKAKGGDLTAIIWFEKTRSGRAETKAIDIARAETEKAMAQFFVYLQSVIPADEFQDIMERYQAHLDVAAEKAEARGQ